MSEIDEILLIQDETELIIELTDMLHDKVIDYDDLSGLNSYEKNILYLQMIEDQVNNGGFSQYFFNSSGRFASEGIAALNLINAVQMGDIVKRAAEAYPSHPIPKDTELRCQQIENLPKAIDDIWNKLDDEFLKYPNDIGKLTIEYVKANRKHFY